VLAPVLRKARSGGAARDESPLQRSDLLLLGRGDGLRRDPRTEPSDVRPHRVSAIAGSLLLNLEAPLTMLIAVAVFKEHLGGRQAIAASLILLGAAIVGLQPEISGPTRSASWRSRLRAAPGPSTPT